MNCLKHTDTLHGDHFTIDKPREASCAALPSPRFPSAPACRRSCGGI